MSVSQSKEKVEVSIDDLVQLQNKSTLTDKSTKDVAAFLNKTFGRGTVKDYKKEFFNKGQIVHLTVIQNNENDRSILKRA